MVTGGKIGGEAAELPVITYLLVALMVTTSFGALVWPPLASFVSGVGRLTYPWQPWTAVFVHGWPGMPVPLHLGGNLLLLALVGPPVERRLGAARFLLLTLLAIATAGILRLLTDVEFNGASAFIWAYAPLLWLLIRRGDVADKALLLWVMWLIVPLAMGLVLALNGANLLAALLLGNVYHLSGTAVGVAAALYLPRRISRPE